VVVNAVELHAIYSSIVLQLKLDAVKSAADCNIAGVNKDCMKSKVKLCL